jgi:hypothetical protein
VPSHAKAPVSEWRLLVINWVVAVYRLVFLVSLVVSLPTHAFNFSTHAKICALAYQQVSREVQTNIDALVAQASLANNKKITNFPQLCGWPDTVRKQAEYKHTGRWHYLNVARSSSVVKSDDCPIEGCVLSAIDDMFKRLQGSPKTEWEALGFLGHFIGDIHQPMHVSYADDRGGNRTKVYYEGDRTNLHKLWDNNIVGTFPANSDLYQASALPLVNVSQATLIWANESLTQTRKIYKGYRSGMSITENDIIDDRRWITTRISQAASRLAGVLESALKVNQVPAVE